MQQKAGQHTRRGRLLYGGVIGRSMEPRARQTRPFKRNELNTSMMFWSLLKFRVHLALSPALTTCAAIAVFAYLADARSRRKTRSDALRQVRYQCTASCPVLL
jgi:hypothetical protein